MKILVFIKDVPDVRIPVEEAVVMLNPPDRSALETAVGIGSHVTAVHIGPGERFLREALALGCDSGVRVWDEDLEALLPGTKALIGARVARILGFDLLLTGARSQDTANGQTGILLASHLQIPCITSVTSLRAEEGVAVASKRLAGGYHARVESPIPLVVSMEALEESLEPSLSARLVAEEKEIASLCLSDLGIPRSLIVKMERDLAIGQPGPPRSKLKYIQPPDSTLPAFMRIGKLVEGTVKTRQGRLVDGPEEDVAEELFRTLLEEGCLDHLKG